VSKRQENRQKTAIWGDKWRSVMPNPATHTQIHSDQTVVGGAQVVPIVAVMLSSHMNDLGLSVEALRRLWLNQANAFIKRLIAIKVLGYAPEANKKPNGP
jgi:3-oxoacyl-[acyl-carrier-protein] synthase III